MFINYNAQHGIMALTINTFRDPGADAGSLEDLLKALAAEDGRVCCDYDGARLALEDGAYLASINADQEVVENLRDS
jgi:hypothetical protein